MKRIIGYVNTADLNHMREEDVRALTVINIAFGLIRDGEVVWDAKDARDGIVSIRKSNPELKIVLSVGGWGADGFSQAARTKEGRERFAASALAIVKEYGLDGIDIDWSIRAHRWQELRRTDRIKRIIRCFWRSFGRHWMRTEKACL